MRVVESFQDSEGGVKMTQGVARASRNPVLRCVIPLGSRTLIQYIRQTNKREILNSCGFGRARDLHDPLLV